jgi:CubicO group peptidase (beta-lactamase class C family)
MPPTLALAALLLPLAAMPQDRDPLADAPASRLARYLHAAAIKDDFSGAVLVQKGDATLYEAGFGLADREHGAANTPATKFRLGSITKQFTAMAVLILQERGKLAVDDPIATHLGDVPAAWKDVTIRHLLTHTSGVPNYTDFFGMMQTTVRTPATVDRVIATFRDRPLDFPPGTKFAYSNSGYILLGKIIEKASGESYERFLRAAIFEPLGMKDTGYDHAEAVLPGRAEGYQRLAGVVLNATHIDMSWPYAAGALYSTVRDLATWDRALRAGKLISSENYKAMFTPFKDGYAFGWGVGKRGDRAVISHGGGINGFQTQITRIPDEGLCVVVLSNVVPSQAGRIAGDLVTIALGEELKSSGSRKAAAIDPKSFDALAGRYQIAPGKVLAFRRDGGRYFTQLTGQGELEIFPESETEFFLKAVEASLTFRKGEDGRATRVILHQNGVDQEARRIEGEGGERP